MLPLDKALPRQYNQYCYGPVAQLGAHYIRIVGVGSSNLLRSTNKKPPDKGGFLLVWHSQEKIGRYKCNNMYLITDNTSHKAHNSRSSFATSAVDNAQALL